MVTDILIVGASGTALDVLDMIAALNHERPRYRCAGVLDDNRTDSLAGLPVLGRLSDACRIIDRLAEGQSPPRLVDALGSPRSFRKRPDIIATTGIPPESFVTMVHPRATVSPRASIGQGSLIWAGAVIGSGVTLGLHVQVLPNTVVNHEASVGDWSILTSGVNLSGRVRVGRGCYLGTGSSVIHDGEIGDGALVGMGAVVIRPIPPGMTVAGVPACPIASR